LLQSAITRVITVAAGRFAPGHLGELTQQVPFEMVDAVLAETGAVQRRLRDLPSRVVVYLLLAGCLFAELGYRQVWHRLAAGLDGIDLPDPSEEALTKARRRVGPAPLRALFDLLRGPAATSAGPVRWRGLLVCAIDGTIMSVADSRANLTVFSKQRGGATGGSSYPMLRLLAVVACGTRTIIDAVFGPISSGETTYARQLVDSLHAGMLVLADRNFAAGGLFAAIADTDAHLLVRAKTGAGSPHLPVLRRHRDGSYRSAFGGKLVRVVEAEITITTTAGTVTGAYRDDRRHQQHTRRRPGPGQLHHRPARRPRSGRAGRRRHRRHRHRPRRGHRPSRAGQPDARPATAHQRPHRQTRDLQVQRPRPDH
jgi:hypothetical protein